MGLLANAMLQPLYPWERAGTHCTGDWVGPRAGLDGCGKSRPHRNSIPGPSSPYTDCPIPAHKRNMSNSGNTKRFLARR
jgi:hypothetical protein